MRYIANSRWPPIRSRLDIFGILALTMISRNWRLQHLQTIFRGFLPAPRHPEWIVKAMVTYCEGASWSDIRTDACTILKRSMVTW